MNNIIWYRSSEMEKEELEAAQNHFTCVDSRVKIQKDDLVIPRYSALPFFKEQAYDIETCIGAKLINSTRQHYYIADMRNWIEDVKELTPETWYRLEDIPDSCPGPFVLKGQTNSRKGQWKTHMYAENKRDAGEVYWRLQTDALIIGSYQNIYIRKYEPLVKLLDGVGGIPVSKEFRFFICDDEIISSGFYWSNYIDDLPSKPDYKEVPLDFIKEIISRVHKQSRFYVIDIAQKQNGEWLVIELNDGTMSGLSENKPEELYSNLKRVLEK